MWKQGGEGSESALRAKVSPAEKIASERRCTRWIGFYQEQQWGEGMLQKEQHVQKDGSLRKHDNWGNFKYCVSAGKATEREAKLEDE